MKEDPSYKEIYEFIDSLGEGEKEVHFDVSIGVDPVDEIMHIKATIRDTSLTVYIVATSEFHKIVSFIMNKTDDGSVKAVPIQNEEFINNILQEIQKEWQT